MNGAEAFTKQGAELLAQSSGCSVWKFRNETGDGTMTCYELFDGVQLFYNDFHMEYVDSGYVPQNGVLVADHCSEGLMEYEYAENTFSYFDAHDVKLDTRQIHTGRFVFPSCHFHGITVGFATAIAERLLNGMIDGMTIDFDKFTEKFRMGKYPVVIRKNTTLDSVFSGMYGVPDSIRLPYLRVKVLELLLCLDAAETSEDEKRQYFYRTQVEKVKAIKTFLAENMSDNFTQEELSEQFEIPLTTMKSCFRSVYGTSIGAWLTGFRMNRAAEMLINDRNKSAAEIAGLVGYDSASKFAATFKRIMGRTPIEYRKDIR